MQRARIIASIYSIQSKIDRLSLALGTLRLVSYARTRTKPALVNPPEIICPQFLKRPKPRLHSQ